MLRLTRRARRDLIDIWKHVARDRPAVADDMLRRIDRQFRSLASNPGIGRDRPDLGGDVRTFVIERWLIVYRIGQDAVIVSRVIDGSRSLPALPFPRR